MIKSATPHWLMQRITAIVLIPLSLRFIVFLDLCLNSTFEETKTWLSTSGNTAWILLWLLAVFYHAAIGLQVVIEDYVGNTAFQNLMIKVVNFSFLAMTVAVSLFMFRSL